MVVHIGFTGTREGCTIAQLNVIHELYTELVMTDLHHGDCIGADDQAHVMAVGFGCRIHLHPPIARSGRAFCLLREGVDVMWTPKRHLDRNHDIVDASMALIAAPWKADEQLRGGTWSTVRYARKVGKKVYLVLPDGRVT